jgi:hypothetical protein
MGKVMIHLALVLPRSCSLTPEPACHTAGRGFESRPLRHISEAPCRIAASGASRFRRHAAHASGCFAHHSAVFGSADAPGRVSRFALKVLSGCVGCRSEAQHGVWSGDGPIGLDVGANVDFHLLRLPDRRSGDGAPPGLLLRGPDRAGAIMSVNIIDNGSKSGRGHWPSETHRAGHSHGG